MEVYLRGQRQPVELAEVERDDETAIIGTTNSGKKFVARADNARKEPLPARHPFRIYANGAVYRTIDPSFEDVEAWYLNESGEFPDTIQITQEDAETYTLSRDRVVSILSAMPEDEVATVAAANGHAESEVDDGVDDSGE